MPVYFLMFFLWGSVQSNWKHVFLSEFAYRPIFVSYHCLFVCYLIGPCHCFYMIMILINFLEACKPEVFWIIFCIYNRYHWVVFYSCIANLDSLFRVQNNVCMLLSSHSLVHVMDFGNSDLRLNDSYERSQLSYFRICIYHDHKYFFFLVES